MINHLDLFTGIGGFSLAADWVWGEEHNIVAFCESDKFCRKILKKHWPDVPIYKDITKLNGKEITETIDLLTAGVPCQPASIAGKRRGKEDDRWLWPQAHRIVRETHPRWVIFENPNGILTLNDGLEFDNLLSELETEGYEIQTFIIPACGVDARHRRYRVWIIAHFDSIRRNKSFSKRNTIQRKNETCEKAGNSANIIANTTGVRMEGHRASGEQVAQIPSGKRLSGCNNTGDRASIWPVEPDVARLVYGVSPKLDKDRIAALGNAIVPEGAEVIMRGIKEVEDMT